MSESRAPDARPYHHGDLRRGLVEAARRLLEREGPAALSLRAVAREAGVSPAAPYHHFKDKSELLDAVADQGWAMLTEGMIEALNGADETDQLSPVMLAYVRFAREHPALYRVMYDAARNRESLPMREDGDGSAYDRVRETIVNRGENPSGLDIELSMAAGWCAAHGLAEMAGFKQFDHLKDELGGEMQFLSAVLRHMGLYRPQA
jgi:AcrR family transcriptional regulator